MGTHVKPVGYIERVGDCIIKKVANYGKKYIVYQGRCFWRMATIRQARLLAYERFNMTYGKV